MMRENRRGTAKIVFQTIVFQLVTVLCIMGVMYIANLRVEIKPNIHTVEVVKEITAEQARK